MSGFGVVASLLFTTLLVVQLMVHVVSTFESLMTAQFEVSGVGRKNSYELKLLSITENVVKIAITNRGPYDISVKNLLTSDLIIVYFDQNSVKKVKHLEYKPDSNHPSKWNITSVKLGDFDFELLDPIDLFTGLEGVWNAGETLIALVLLDEPVNSSLPVFFRFEVVV
ncbi:MAG: hypothetical protein RMK31_08865 [Candidatus Caldarchaeum sp.]|nr:hypothetical protein [Candidatus Caldarchaeum sp.]MDW8360673.1 hypothetical protein [Candidatus Caldarchaeum sp.]